MAAIEINGRVSIDESELTYRATRSGGPGGQHVNTSATRIELLWNVGASPSISDADRARIRKRLANRIDQSGVLRLVEGGSRSQHRNRQEVTERFARMLARALAKRKKRKKTRPGRAARERRLREKKHRSQIKKDRGPIRPDE